MTIHGSPKWRRIYTISTQRMYKPCIPAKWAQNLQNSSRFCLKAIPYVHPVSISISILFCTIGGGGGGVTLTPMPRVNICSPGRWERIPLALPLVLLSIERLCLISLRCISFCLEPLALQATHNQGPHSQLQVFLLRCRFVK